MSTHKYIDRICCVVLACTLLLTILLTHAESFGITRADSHMGYEDLLFDTSAVHTIDIVMDDWDGFIETCTDETYALCSVVIDKEAYKNVAIRAKGNTSLTQVESYGNDRYSFKIEFDHYDNTTTYHGLDKLSLNNLIQDNTYMKDYLVYQMMGSFQVDAPLCSFVYITVNGEDWGLYLAVEGVEDAFLQRNYGSDSGELYKPDSQSMGGGRGNGGDFHMENWNDRTEQQAGSDGSSDTDAQDDLQVPDQKQTGRAGGMGSSDVSLIYSDDAYTSYQNIFDNAKTDITDADKDRLIEAIRQMNEKTHVEEAVNTDEVMRYFVVHNFVCNFDSYTGSMIHNYYLYEEDGQLSMIPWDYNLAFGSFISASDATGLVNYPIDTPVSGGTIESRPMLAWIFSDETYTEQYHQYFAEWMEDYFESGYFSDMIDRVRDMIAPYVEKDPTKFCTYEEFETGIATLKEFCLLRAESVRGQLDGSIASTADGQAQNTDGMIDASGITISDMGNMNRGKGGAMAQPTGNEPDVDAETNDFTSEPKRMAPSDAAVPPGNRAHPESRTLPENPDNGQNEPAMSADAAPPQEESLDTAPADNSNGVQNEAENKGTQAVLPTETQPDTINWRLLIPSVIALAAGIVLVFLYRKRA
ncbi:CotH kinase family protein [Butyricicoccus sp.]|uniref:CotH kinase family protein n=1 Tax=Butyricicoccus sp. TaxID=2049021 RepID=UPI003F17F065